MVPMRVIGEVEALAEGIHGAARRRRRAEQQLVVVTAGQEVGERRRAPGQRAPRGFRERHGVRRDARAHPRLGAEMAQVGNEPVGHVDGARRDIDECRAQRKPGLGQTEALGERREILRRKSSELAAHGAQAQRRVADGTGDVDVVAFARARAGEAGIARDGAEGGEREHGRPLCRHRVAADQRDPERLLILREAGGERLHPGVGDIVGQREAEGVRPRGGAHGREVREVHAEQPAGEDRGVFPLGVVDARHHQVLGDDEAFARRRCQQRAVVPEREGARRGAAQRPEEALDEAEFTGPARARHGPLRPPSPPRAAAARGCPARR